MTASQPCSLPSVPLLSSPLSPLKTEVFLKEAWPIICPLPKIFFFFFFKAEIREVTSLLPLSSGPGDTDEGAILLDQCQRKEKEKEKGFYVGFKCKRHDLPSVSSFSSALIWPRGLVNKDTMGSYSIRELKVISRSEKGKEERQGRSVLCLVKEAPNWIKYFT